MVRKFLVVGAALFSVCMNASAANNLAGAYSGKVADIQGYAGKVGDACTVKISHTSEFGGSMEFNINDIEKASFSDIELEKALGAGQSAVKLMTPEMSGNDLQLVFLKLSKEGLPVFIKMVRKNGFRHTQAKFISCEQLVAGN